MTATHGRAVPSREKSWPPSLLRRAWPSIAIAVALIQCDLDRIVRLRRQQIALTGGRKLWRSERYARAGAPGPVRSFPSRIVPT